MLNKKAIRGGARLFLINHSGTSSQERSRPALQMLPLFTSRTALTILTSTEGKTALLTSRNRQNQNTLVFGNFFLPVVHVLVLDDVDVAVGREKHNWKRKLSKEKQETKDAEQKTERKKKNEERSTALGVGVKTLSSKLVFESTKKLWQFNQS